MLKEAKLFDLVIGIIMAILGVYIWMNPMDTLVAVSTYIGIIFVIIGVIYIFEFITRKHDRYLTYGILDVLIGTVLMSRGAFVVTSLSIILGLWILFTSILQITAAVRFKKINLSFWTYPLAVGILGVIFSFIILHNPAAGILTIAIALGAYMVFYGLLMISEYFFIRDLDEE